MCESFSASGFFVQTPCGPRKSAMPDSVEMPAPVSTTMRDASSIQRLTMALTFVSTDMKVHESHSPRPLPSPGNCPMTDTLEIRPWPDPVINTLGHDPR